ncbi:MAG: DUF2269 family protein, partial [Chloroflexi bacterium]|nr:DUF2269 family protein [Chloroflexota bacterium]
ERNGEMSVLQFASRAVRKADLLFTGPGVILVLGNGLALAADAWGGWSGLHRNAWISLALGLFAASGVVWVAFLLRYQSAMGELSNAGVGPDGGLPIEFFEVLHKWYVWGTVATVLPLVSLYLMVVKPTLWS